MKKYAPTIITISVVILSAIVTCLIVIFWGNTTNGENYVQIEVNPKIEFLVNEKGQITYYYPLNTECEELIINEEFLNINIKDGVTKFLKLCTQMGYLSLSSDIDENNNAVNITVIDGITQVMDIDIYTTVNNYLLQNEILSVITENKNDLALFKECKEKNIMSPNKLKLINSLIFHNPLLSIDELNKLDENSLIEMLEDMSITLPNPTEQQYNNKTKLIDFNRLNYEEHLDKITDSTTKEYKQNLIKYQAQKTNQYEQNFEDKYEKWVGKS